MRSTASAESSSSSPRRVRRRWRVPPALVHGPESLESAGILEEITGAAGLVLWQSLRDVTLWAATAPAARGELFSDSAERRRLAALLSARLEKELEAPLGVITGMVGRPGRVPAEAVGLACRKVAQWAERQGKLSTALSYAQAAALACPGDASAGFKVGQLSRKRAEYARAETWFRRTIALARQSQDWSSYALAFSGLGNLYVQRGNFPRARVLHTRALRAAKRHSLRSIHGGALHDLHVIATASGHSKQAQEYARAAFDVYGPTHHKIPVLAQDVAYFCMTQGLFVSALQVFQALLPHVERSIEWIVLMPNLVRAAGGAGDRKVFEQGWQDVWDKINHQVPGKGHAEALLELGRGAASLQEWDRAELAATRALQLARARKEARIELESEAVLDWVGRQRDVGSPQNHELSAVESMVAESLAGDLVETLDAHAAIGY